MDTCGELELKLTANQAEAENKARLLPGPEPDGIKILEFFF